MLTTHLTQKGQATIPVKIRKHLNLSTGDLVQFNLKNNQVTLTKASQNKTAELSSLASTLEPEWNSKADDQAYENL